MNGYPAWFWLWVNIPSYIWMILVLVLLAVIGFFIFQARMRSREVEEMERVFRRGRPASWETDSTENPKDNPSKEKGSLEHSPSDPSGKGEPEEKGK